MRVVIQRVSSASVSIEENQKAYIDKGLLILLGITSDDNDEDIEWLCKKIVQLRIFNDQNGLMNSSALDVDAQFLVVSQFTLFAKTKKGNRPSFIKAASPEIAVPLYQKFLHKLNEYTSKEIKCGEFGANMKLELCNDGPVTIIMDSKNKE